MQAWRRATGEITIILDADSELSPGAIWKIVQPLADPTVRAVSGNVRVRNADQNLLTRIQAFEYLRSVFMGRIVMSRLGILGIVSGAFGAFRTSLIRDIGGWDVGPGEDEDMVLRIRKLGYQIEFQREADCHTDVPESWKVLTKQRRRWEWAVVTFDSRKHIDMANPLNEHFRLSNFVMFAERWLFNLLLPLWFWVYVGWLACHYDLTLLVYPTVLFYLLYMLGDLLQYLIILDYSFGLAPRHHRDPGDSTDADVSAVPADRDDDRDLGRDLHPTFVSRWVRPRARPASDLALVTRLAGRNAAGGKSFSKGWNSTCQSSCRLVGGVSVP